MMMKLQPFNGLFSRTTRKVKPIWILLEQETVSGSGISWDICKSAPRSRQITTPVPHHSVFYKPDALPAAQPTASKHWRILYDDESTQEMNKPLSYVSALAITKMPVIYTVSSGHRPGKVTELQSGQGKDRKNSRSEKTCSYLWHATTNSDRQMINIKVENVPETPSKYLEKSGIWCRRAVFETDAHLYSLVDILLISSDLIRSEKAVRVAGNAVADAIAFTKKSSVPQHLGTFLHCFQVLGITKYLPQSIKTQCKLRNIDPFLLISSPFLLLSLPPLKFQSLLPLPSLTLSLPSPSSSHSSSPFIHPSFSLLFSPKSFLEMGGVTMACCQCSSSLVILRCSSY